MRLFRIKTNGHDYRIEWRYHWWPFWSYVKTVFEPFGLGPTVPWTPASKEKAEQWIKDELEQDEIARKAWRLE